MKRLALLAMLSICIGCASTPPNLSPQGNAAFKGTQVIKALDVLRDAAIDANKLTPPLVSEDSTRKVVLYHKGAITTIHDVPTGWKTSVETGLNQLSAALPANEQAQLGPYITLAKTLMAEVSK